MRRCAYMIVRDGKVWFPLAGAETRLRAALIALHDESVCIPERFWNGVGRKRGQLVALVTFILKWPREKLCLTGIWAQYLDKIYIVRFAPILLGRLIWISRTHFWNKIGEKWPREKLCLTGSRLQGYSLVILAQFPDKIKNPPICSKIAGLTPTDLLKTFLK